MAISEELKQVDGDFRGKGLIAISEELKHRDEGVDLRTNKLVGKAKPNTLEIDYKILASIIGFADLIEPVQFTKPKTGLPHRIENANILIVDTAMDTNKVKSYMSKVVQTEAQQKIK
ncbi:hypothetical protein LXL04_003068 [Taraxacum kok-saghyz]